MKMGKEGKRTNGNRKPFFSIFLVALLLAAATAIAFLRQDVHERRPATDGVTMPTPDPYEDTFHTLEMTGREILVHCGNSMRPGAETLAGIFQEKHGIAVRFNFGGSAELLPAIELGRRGDLYLCHDPYAEILEEKGLLDRYETVGWLEPVIIVPEGNPLEISSLEDLTRPGLRVGIPDARFATAAKLAREALRESGIEEDFDRNLALETRGHNDQALAVISGHLDASVVWSFIPSFYRGELSGVDAGRDFPETRVTLCLLTTAADREAAEKFMALASSEEGRRIFREQGYGRGIFKE